MSIAGNDSQLTPQQQKFFEAYRGLAKQMARRYFRLNLCQSEEFDDYWGLAQVGLFQAVRDYRPEEGIDFSRFLGGVIRRQILTLWKASRRHKHRALNDASSLDQLIEQGIELAVDPRPFANPEQVVLQSMEQQICFKRLRWLCTDLEYRVVMLRIIGESYPAIAKILGVNKKAIDNALSRVKRKLARKNASNNSNKIAG